MMKRLSILFVILFLSTNVLGDNLNTTSITCYHPLGKQIYKGSAKGRIRDIETSTGYLFDTYKFIEAETEKKIWLRGTCILSENNRDNNND